VGIDVEGVNEGSRAIVVGEDDVEDPPAKKCLLESMLV
jgi:hypothetical protein